MPHETEPKLDAEIVGPPRRKSRLFHPGPVLPDDRDRRDAFMGAYKSASVDDDHTDSQVESLNRLIARLVVFALLITACGMYFTSTVLVFNRSLFDFIAYATLLFVFSRLLASRRMRLPYHVAIVLLWILLCRFSHVLPMYVAGRMHVQFSDRLLASCDESLGLKPPDIVAFARSRPVADYCFGYIYMSLDVMVSGALIIASMVGRIVDALENILASLVAVFLSFPIFAVFQAWGPWRYYGYSPLIDQSGYEREFTALKQMDVFYIDYSRIHGIICFPSFHTILAVLAGVTLSRIPYLWPIGAPWAGLIIVSTLTTGTHYVADVLAGFVVAAFSVLAAKHASRAKRSGRTAR